MKRVGVCSASMRIARLGRVDALAEHVEVLAALVVEEDDLAVEHVAALGERELGEVAAQRAAVARLQVDVGAVDEGDRAEPVPLGLVGVALAGRGAPSPSGRAAARRAASGAGPRRRSLKQSAPRSAGRRRRALDERARLLDGGGVEHGRSFLGRVGDA